MSSSQATEQHTSPLSNALEQVADIDRKLDSLNREIEGLKKKRQAIAAVAVEEMTSGRIDGVRVAGRSWRVEWDHSISATASKADDVIAAARALGKGDALVTVSTPRLKSLLKELAKEAGRDPRQPWAEGTPFAGLVSEFVQPVLRHLTVGGSSSAGESEAAPF